MRVEELLTGLVLASATLTPGAQAVKLPDSNQLHARQANSNTPPRPNGYAPLLAACPAVPSGQSSLVRDAARNTLSPAESDYINRHKRATQQSWKDWLSRPVPGAALGSAIKGGVDSYLNNLDNVPRVGLALSGGSFRATLFGAGYLQGIDGRNTSAQSQGVAGMLQLASHVSGLSGGSWAVGSLAVSDWPTVATLHDSIWQLESGILGAPQASTSQPSVKALLTTPARS